jgi:rod shape determining protein RodA
VLFHVTINVGMVLGLMPVAGIPLPLVSAGGSSLITSFAALAICQNIRMRRYVN